MNAKKVLLVLVGPTAVGKTALAVQLAKCLNTVVISADSRQFFKEMSIGSAKPSALEMQGIPHYFINSHSVSGHYNAGSFANEAVPLIENLFQEHGLLILAGGSGLYVDAVCSGMDELPQASAEIRGQLAVLYTEKGIEALQQQLIILDPEYAKQVDMNNPQRLKRALEVCLATGKPYSELRSGQKKKRDFTVIKVGLELDRPVLYQRINERVDQMMTDGLLEEVRALLPFRHMNALQTVGYKELFDYLEGKISLSTAVELIKQHTRNFAKRQLTWFKRDPEIHWFQPSQLKDIIQLIEQQTGITT